MSQNLRTDAETLIQLSIPFLFRIRDMTPGPEVEDWLNQEYGPRSAFYRGMAGLALGGLREGWAANVEIDGSRYRRSLIAEPSMRTHWFSITSVYMDSMANGAESADRHYRGQFHVHPYGEFNMVIPLTPNARLAGPRGWCGEGWTAPAPGSRHYPEVRGGALVALFYLPAGRIAYPEPGRMGAPPASCGRAAPG